MVWLVTSVVGCAELQRCAQQAIGFLEAAAAARAGGAAVQCRTIAYSGYAGLVSYSMSGAISLLLGVSSSVRTLLTEVNSMRSIYSNVFPYMRM